MYNYTRGQNLRIHRSIGRFSRQNKRQNLTPSIDHRRKLAPRQLNKAFKAQILNIGSAAINTIINDHLKFRKLANQRLFLIILQVSKLGFTILIQKQNGKLVFGALQNHLLLRKMGELKVLKNKWSVVFFRKYLKNQANRPRAQLRGVFLHYDNARPHTSVQTLDFKANSGVQLVTHSPFSPNLVPCVFF
ncbi:hypothetical protein LAZ67_4002426 [Cordylochernes scorpioides]|uniref:Histone-lysine N-methyltransferase SETMAR n=1 Tax=Cordylochernes scorpioides TaxID=51811 RepID=A0ABY6KCR7_9ARAC|nr:hypothetical protein LAZ67_4002426 [Cordylochernes scorpioides]